MWKLLDDRNRELGLTRYDYGDVNSSSFMCALSQRPYVRSLYKPLKVPEHLFPVLWRKLLRVPKTIVPSVYYHIGLAYLDGEKVSLEVSETDTHSICDCAINAGIQDAEHLCWRHPYRHHGGTWKNNRVSRQVPPSCAHHTGRVGIMLLTVGIEHGNYKYIEAGVSASKALLSYHNWQLFDVGTCAISYYPNTIDEVINTAADVALLMALVPYDYKTEEMRSRIDCLLKMICTEQNDDGSWYYCTRNHYRVHGGVRYIDNHHTAMNIAALAQIAGLKVLGGNIEAKVIQTIEAGVTYYLDNFISECGDGYYYPKSRRDAGVVGHAEGVSALLKILILGEKINAGVRHRIESVLPLLLERAISKYVDYKTGDVACYKNYGRKYQIASARWGSAPLMQAISAYLKYHGDDSVYDKQ